MMMMMMMMMVVMMVMMIVVVIDGDDDDDNNNCHTHTHRSSPTTQPNTHHIVYIHTNHIQKLYELSILMMMVVRLHLVRVIGMCRRWMLRQVGDDGDDGG